MTISRYWTKILSVSLVVVFLGVLMINFDNIFTDLNCDALTVSDNVKETPNEAPVSLNFIDEDKTCFIDYCKDLYGENLPLETDNNVFHYYGTVNGFRFYRIHASYIPCENINQQQVVGGYIFESSARYRPDKTGLYVIGNNRVYTIDEAYTNKLIDIAKLYKLYSKEN